MVPLTISQSKNSSMSCHFITSVRIWSRVEYGLLVSSCTSSTLIGRLAIVFYSGLSKSASDVDAYFEKKHLLIVDATEPTEPKSYYVKLDDPPLFLKKALFYNATKHKRFFYNHLSFDDGTEGMDGLFDYFKYEGCDEQEEEEETLILEANDWINEFYGPSFVDFYMSIIS